ncbi:kinesin-like protein KIF15 [Stylophora pistillata]|uniref:kinesin-like protein KIF15 n=1 Tax=Stylophora pistillata TaxID=50429 RepID=UPI000C051962|nr:kinesin-like protein KIF15 [Stylophora pistillata]
MKPQKGEKCETTKVGRDSGRVKVFVRVRPPRPNENNRKEQIAVNVEELSSKIHVTDSKHSWEKTFNFDHVFPKEATNPEVCSTISRPLVNAALNGFNGTLMAYGQTGSGKTHTLMAPDGITAGVIERCFKRITKDDYHDYKVTMSYLQIYQEKIYDLLNSTNKVELSLREHPVKGVYVENLTEFVVRSPSEVLHLLAVGKKRLIFAETKMNRNSSRSHSVCQLTIERTLNKNKMNAEGIAKHGANGRDSRDGLVPSKTSSDHEDSGEDLDAGASEANDNEEDESLAKMVAFDDDVLIRGRIYLCDLAGSERLKKTQAEGERLSEAQHINLSLLELGNVIQALAEGKKTHVPFRNSTLTRLLQESLGGNCKTSLVVCVSPTMGDVSETKSTLFFGSRAMKITNTAYINVEVDYKRLSEDLSKIVDRREKDLEDLKQTFETRIERLKHEAERTVTNAMAEADRVVASVKSLYENEKSSLESDIENLNFRLDEEKTHTENLQDQITKAKGKLQEDMFKARSTLLSDIISMQLLYALKDLPLDNDHHFSENDLSLRDFCSQWATTKCKILENADVLLDLLKSYLSLMNSKGDKLLEDGGSLKSLVGCEESFNADKRLLSASEEVSLYMTNKTDDDKVVASTGCCEILPCSETNTEDFILSTEQNLGDGEESSNIRNKLISLKKFMDDKALAFLTKAFELDVGNENRVINTRQDIYGRIQEILNQEDTLPDFRENAAELSHVADALGLLDHCHSHVIVDKALQGALLVLENNIVIKRCNVIQKQKDVLQDENETLRKQIQILQKEAEKLNGKLNETSSSLCDVMKSKEQLEDDLSSVFQLHNMRNIERKIQKENDGKLDMSTILQENVTTLLENNTKLQETLQVSENDKENLKSELTSVKEELQRLKEGYVQDEKGTQTDLVGQNEFMKPHLGDQSKTISDRNGIIHAILSSLHDDQSSLLEKAAFAAQSNNVDDVSSLRAVINHRLGEEWSLVVLENARMKSELDGILGRINEEKRNLVSELADWKFQAAEVNSMKEELNTKGEDFADGFKVPMDENENGSSDKLISKIDIYNQNEVIAELRMDEQEDKGEPRREGSTAGDYWESIVKEKLGELSVVHRETERHEVIELDSLESKYSDPEKDQDNSNKIREKELRELLKRERQLTTNIMQLDEKCSSLEKQLGRSALENTKLKEQLRKLKIKISDVEQEKAEITAQKIALEESSRELQQNAKREIAVEKERTLTLEKQLQAKTQEFGEGKALLKLKDARVSEVEAELLETKAYYKKLLQENSHEYEVDQQNMMKEINSLRCLQGLPTLKKDSVQSKQEVKGGLMNGENQAENKKDNKLNSELTRAKEQLVRLKAELTLSNMQTRNLGSQLSSLREDSTKLEAELSTVRVSPRNSRQRRASFSFYEETVRLEMELAEAKEKIIDLQEKLLIIYKEKFALEEKIVSLEGQRNVHLENGAKLYSANDDHEPFCDLEKTKVLKSKIGLLEAEKEQLKRELDNTNADKTRLESIEHCVQQLVSLEDEHLRVKDRLKKWAQNSTDEQQLNETRKTVNKFPENSYFNELRVLSGENLVLQEEVSGLRETIAQLESDLAALKLKLSIADAAQDDSLDKKTVATLLVSVKQERAELQKALNDALIEKDDLDEELSEIKVKYAKLQREFAMTSIVKDDLELEVLSLKKASLARGLSNLTQSSEDCKSEMSDSSVDDKLIDRSDENGVGDSMDKKIASPGGGRKRAPALNSRKTVITKNLKAERDSFSSGRSTSSSSSKNEKKTLSQRPNSLQSVPLPPKKSVERRAKSSESGGEKLSSRTPRSITDDQSTDDNPQHLAICYDLIRIDDAVSEACARHVNTDCINSGLLRKTPEGQRLNPEGMEHDNETCFDTDNTEHVDKKDSSDNFLDDTVEIGAHQGATEGISETDFSLSQSTEVLVKTTWSLKNLFRWQKSAPIPDHKIDALTQ